MSNISKVGLVSRNFTVKDFSQSMHHILSYLDEQECDVALFSLYSFEVRNGNPIDFFPKPVHIKMIVLELFDYIKTEERVVKHCSVFIKEKSTWVEKKQLHQRFGRVNWNVRKSNEKGKYGTDGVRDFIGNELKERKFLSNIGVLLCGEINAAKYSKTSKAINDIMGLQQAVEHHGMQIILNPGHDRMTRFEMPLKRQHLSQNNRWVLSVWNKGGGKPIGKSPAWEVWHNGDKVNITDIADPQQFKDIEIGVVDLFKS